MTQHLDLDEIERQANAAMPGPWERVGNTLYLAPDYYVPMPGDWRTADFIAACRVGVPALVEHARALRARVEELEGGRNSGEWIVGFFGAEEDAEKAAADARNWREVPLAIKYSEPDPADGESATGSWYVTATNPTEFDTAWLMGFFVAWHQKTYPIPLYEG